MYVGINLPPTFTQGLRNLTKGRLRDYSNFGGFSHALLTYYRLATIETSISFATGEPTANRILGQPV